MADKGLTLTQKRIQNNKIFVYACLVLSLALDIAVFVMLVAYALPAKYWVISILFAVFDLGFLAVSLASNFRFGYFRPYLIIYGIALTALSVVAVVVGADSGAGTAYTTLALIAYPVMHIIAVVTVVIAVVFSVKSGTKSKIGGLVIAIAMLAASAAYSVLLVENGYFGQPLEENRALLFSYNEYADGYAVVGVESGSGTKIVIPDEFNGKKVYAVDCSVFNAEGITKAELNCALTVKFENEEALDNIRNDLTVYVDKQNYDTVRNRFYKGALTDFIRCMVPNGLDKDEVFVSFGFPAESESVELYPTWYGKKGDILTLGDDAPEWYKHSDNSSDEDLSYSFYNYDQKIFYGLTSRGVNINRTAITESHLTVMPYFANVYRISIAEDNDEAFIMPTWFKYSKINGDYDPYRYVTLLTADSFLATAPTRAGFSLVWKNNVGVIPSLSEYLKDGGSTVTIIPVWNLDEPTVSAISGITKLTYGDTLSLSAVATHPTPGINLKYVWKRDTTEVGTESGLNLPNMGVDKGGVYSLEVTAYSENNAITSLASSTKVVTSVTVGKRNLHFNWNVGDSVNYTAEEVEVNATYTPSDVINDDEITFTKSPDASSVRNAGTYRLYVSLYGDCAYKYNAVSEKTFTVNPVPLAITVNDIDKTYDGEPFLSTEFSFSQEGLLSPDKLEKPSYNLFPTKSANAGSYTVSVYFPQGDDVLKNYTVIYTPGTARIDKKDVTVVWDGTTTFTYSANVQYPTVESITGIVEKDLSSYLSNIDYSGGQVNAGTGYTVAASFRSGTAFAGNYTLKSNTCGYSIKAKDITLTWGSDTTFTYNGAAQYPKVISADVADSEKTAFLNYLEYSGMQTDAGQSYTATAAFRQGSGYDKNYNIVSGASCGFVINAKPVTVVWATPDFTYNGAQQKPVVASVSGTVPGGDGIDVSSDITVSVEGGVGAGDYTATATLNGSVINYVFSEPQTYQYSIKRKTVRLTWGTTSFIYNGEKQVPEVTAVLDAIGSEGETVKRNLTIGLGSGDTGIEVGSHAATASVDLNVVKNYSLDLSTRTCAYRIERSELTLEWITGEYTYNGQKQIPSLRIKSGRASRDSESTILQHIEVNLTSGDGISAGEHTVTATAKLTLVNYKIAENGSSCTYTIKSAPLTITWCGPYFIYNGEKHLPSLLSMEGEVPGGEKVNTLDIDIVLTSGDGISAGSHTAAARLNDRIKNYVLTGSNLSITYDIEKRVITLEWEYFGAVEFPHTGSPREVVPTNVLPDGVRLVATYYSLDEGTSALSGAPTEVGSYKVVYSLAGEKAGNYEIENPEKQFTIAQRGDV
ncbi:MAG: hypothetical protein J1F39_02640 [Clostridiales bacterium]|nr:hypothetical protein [Clostridiales bacterium]